ncbi:MAG: sigma-70 family RNA polymerase sigma factor [Chitinophagaceae bacterium]
MEYRQILELIAAKDKKALEVLYEKYGQKFYSYAINKWQMDTEVAWDVVYKTLDTLLLKLSDYKIESQAHFDNLIFKIFVNFLRQAFRANRKKKYVIEYVDFNDQEAEDRDEADHEDAPPPAQSSVPIDANIFNRAYETDVSENPLLTSLKEALAEMDETERNILLLRAQNYSYEEIAQMLNIENKNLKVKYSRGKDKLRKLFENFQTDDHAQQKKQH